MKTLIERIDEARNRSRAPELASVLDDCRSALIAAEGRYRHIDDEQPIADQAVFAFTVAHDFKKGVAILDRGQWRVRMDGVTYPIWLWRPAKAEGVSK